MTLDAHALCASLSTSAPAIPAAAVEAAVVLFVHDVLCKLLASSSIASASRETRGSASSWKSPQSLQVCMSMGLHAVRNACGEKCMR
eukprot:scaffold977_cov253-Pinguiococcus_pyrenoidosus.AAC.15